MFLSHSLPNSLLCACTKPRTHSFTRHPKSHTKQRIASDQRLSVETPAGTASDQQEISIDVTITVPLTFRIGESLDVAARRFCDNHGLDADAFAQVLVDNLREKAAVLSNAQRELESRKVDATLSITTEDGREISLTHYEGDDVVQTVVAFLVENNLDVESYRATLVNALSQLIAASP